MLKKELKEHLSKYEKNDLMEVASILYKNIPKAKKETNEIDEIIINFHNQKTIQKPIQPKEPSLEEAIAEFNNLLENARLGYYRVPNRTISKTDRPKWRFIVKRLINTFISFQGENNERACEMLKEILKMLTYSSQFLLFPSNDPFASVGISSYDLIDAILVKIFSAGYSKETIKDAIITTFYIASPQEFEHLVYLQILLANLTTATTKEIALEILSGEIPDEGIVKFYAPYNFTKFYFRDTEERLYTLKVAFTCMIYLDLKEYSTGINYYKRHIIPVPYLYTTAMLLDILEIYSLDDLWIKEYELAVKNNEDYSSDHTHRYRKMTGEKKKQPQ